MLIDLDPFAAGWWNSRMRGNAFSMRASMTWWTRFVVMSPSCAGSIWRFVGKMLQQQTGDPVNILEVDVVGETSKCSFECRCMSQPFGELKISPFGCEMRPDRSFSTGKCEMPYGQRGKSPENWQSLGFNGFNPEDWGYHNLMESPTRKETQEKIGTGKGGLCVPLFFTEFFSPSSWQRSCLES